jgi:membrane-bound ClpP family serine protease
MGKIKDSLKIASLPVLFASLCCLSPLLLFVFGLASVSVAASMADVFYGTYKWAFRGVGLILLIIGLVMYFRKKNICTFDEVKKHRTKVINTVLLTLFIGVIGYMFFLYVVVHYWGVFLGIWQ